MYDFDEIMNTDPEIADAIKEMETELPYRADRLSRTG